MNCLANPILQYLPNWPVSMLPVSDTNLSPWPNGHIWHGSWTLLQPHLSIYSPHSPYSSHWFSFSSSNKPMSFLILGLSSWQFLWKVLARLPWWLSGKETTCQCKRHSFIPGLNVCSHVLCGNEACASQLRNLCSRVWESQLSSPSTTTT